ncbi:MAG: transposase, partial [Candidatus Omnitrophota bacterium]|nr:transposase [Candidatus Omnitrophota bacterium]
TKHSLTNYLDHYEISSDPLVEIIAYCLMPTHIHLVLKQLKDNGISHFMRNIQNSYTHYFNERYKRKGPLWIGRFKNVLVESDSQLLHLTRYVHLNPSTAGLTRNPLDWHSSYGEYLNPKTNDRLCHWEELIDLSTSQYRAFVEERIDYQRELAFLKHLSDE